MNIHDLFDVRDRTVLVTGGSAGIGAMIAEGLVRCGATVWICSRKAAEIQKMAKHLKQWGQCEALAADLYTQEGIDLVANAISARHSSLDALINNAGTTWAAPVDSYPRAGFEKVLNLNLLSPFMLTQRLLPLLRGSASAAHPARIINIASIDGMRPPKLDSFAYSSSKAGMIMLTRHLAKALAPDHITVNAIAPGVFESRMTEFWFNVDHPYHAPMPSIPLGERTGTAEDIVGAILYLLARSGSHVTGAVLPVAGGEATID